MQLLQLLSNLANCTLVRLTRTSGLPSDPAPPSRALLGADSSENGTYLVPAEDT